jgi:hypothetical protein
VPECYTSFHWVVGEGWMTADAIEASAFETDTFGYAVAFEIRQYVGACAAAEGRSLNWAEIVTAIHTFLAARGSARSAALYSRRSAPGEAGS